MKWRDSLNSFLRARWTKRVVFLLCLAPALSSALSVLYSSFAPSVIESAVGRTGGWTFKLLALTLAVTPLRRLTGLSNLIHFRRMLGLYSFVYGCLHLLAWKLLQCEVTVEHLNPWNRRVAVVALVLMIPLALTSTDSSIQRLGGRRWRMLHSLIYLSAAFGYVHYCAIAESRSTAKAIILGAALIVLLLARLQPAKGP